LIRKGSQIAIKETSQELTGSATEYVYGLSSDTWGLVGLKGSDIKDPTFGGCHATIVSSSVTCIHFIDMKIYYRYTI
jgi:hypothetical protein